MHYIITYLCKIGKPCSDAISIKQIMTFIFIADKHGPADSFQRWGKELLSFSLSRKWNQMGQRTRKEQASFKGFKTIYLTSLVNRNQLDPQAQAGFMSGEGQSFLLPPSGLDQIVNIDKWSNTDVPGLWIYKVGPLDTFGNVEGPEIGVREGENISKSKYLKILCFSVVADPSDARTCHEGKALCHSKAECSDNQFGFCCECNPGW